MKIIDNRNLFLFLITLVVGIFITLSYYTYISYIDYKHTQESYKQLEFINKLNKIIDKIQIEREKSAIYIGTNGKTKFKEIELSRDEVDAKIQDAIIFIQEDELFTPYSQELHSLITILKYIRNTVDTLTEDYKTIIYDNYYKNIMGSVIKNVDTLIITNRGADKVRKRLEIYKELVKYQENSSFEKAYLSYFISGANPLTKDDLKLWEQSLQKDIIPNFSALEDDDTLLFEIENVFPTQEFYKKLSSLRVSLFKNSQKGDYTFSLDDWKRLFKRKVQASKSAEAILFSTIQKNSEKDIKALGEVISNYKDVILIISLFLVIFLFMYYNMDKDERLLEDTLKDISAILDQEQQEELYRLIKNRETNNIYKFLAKTIEEANKAKDLFLASMSHEIRTPLNGIVGFTQLLKNTEVNSEQAEFLTVIEHSSDNLLNIVNDILDFSKIKADKIDLEVIPFDPVVKFESIAESYAARAAEKDLNFTLLVDPTLPTKIQGDPTKISQIVVNLISNAIKFTSKNGSVHISIKKVEDNKDGIKVKFAVTDTGIGITDEQKDKIFEAFSQADSSTSRKFGGTGLGLAISGKLVTLMGGKLDIESQKDVGSTFFFTISLSKYNKTQERVKPKMDGIKAGYIVHEEIREKMTNNNLQYYVEYMGASFTLYNAIEILKLPKEKLPDVLFIDHFYFKRVDEVAKYLEVDTKIVLMTTGGLKGNVKDIDTKVERLFFKPINFNKTLKSLEIVNESPTKDKKVAPKSINTKHFKDIQALVAEDNPINQKLIKNVLEKFGLKVSIAKNGQEAVDMRQQNFYDIIFMDIQMPVMGGEEATLKIIEFEKSTRQKHIPIIALTANALDGDREKYVNAGMDNYASKPISLDEIKKILHEYFPNA